MLMYITEAHQQEVNLSPSHYLTLTYIYIYRHMESLSHTELRLFSFTGNQCFPYDILIQQLNTNASGWVNIFLDIQFVCENPVIGWQYYATSLGVFYAGIWRPLNGETQLKLIGKNEIRPKTLGAGVSISPN